MLKIEIIDNVYITKLLKSNDDVNEEGRSWAAEGEGEGEVKGALGVDIEEKEIVIFECKSLILVLLVDIRESMQSVVLEFLKIMEKVWL